MMTAKDKKPDTNASTRTTHEMIDLLHCARLNFENLERAVPHITLQPMYVIAKAQLDDALGVTDIGDSLKPRWMQ